MKVPDFPPDISAFFERYAEGYAARDAALLATMFAYPAHVVSDAGEPLLVPAESHATWKRRLSELLAMYDEIGFAGATIPGLPRNHRPARAFGAPPADSPISR